MALSIFKTTALPYALLCNFFLIGLPLWLAFNIGFFSTFNFAVTEWWLSSSIYLASFWIWLGPLLICLWEQRYEEFIRQYLTRLRVHSPLEVRRLRSKILMHKKYAKAWGVFIAGLTLFFYSISKEEIARYTDVFERPFLWLVTMVVMTFSGYASGYGFSGVTQAIDIFFRASRFNLKWNPFHHDQRGGFAFFGKFAATTWLCFSGGLVVIPAILAAASITSENAIIVVYISLVGYAFANLGIFLYPILGVYFKAKRAKEELLAALQRQFETEAAKEIDDLFVGRLGKRSDRIISYLEVTQKIGAISEYPVSYATLWRSISVSVLPIVAIILDKSIDVALKGWL